MEAGNGVVQDLIDIVSEISGISDHRNAFRKQFSNLARRVKLLAPMFEEFKESKETLSEETLGSLIALKVALGFAKEVLRSGSEGSKICMVLERDQITTKLQEVTAQLEQALSGVFYDKFDISDEVREQVDLVHAQFKRAKGRVDTLDNELYVDLLSVYNQSNDRDTDPAVLRRLADKLQLLTIADLTQESLVLHEMVVASGDPGERLEKMSIFLKKIKDFVQTQNLDLGGPIVARSFASDGPARVPVDGNPKSPVIPDDFRCPISLELMKDPVIVATGQTYERGCIQRWLDAGHRTCPKTQQALFHNVLTPNYVLRSLIAQWCETNGVETPKQPGPSRTLKAGSGACPSGCSPGDRAAIDALILKLSGTNLDEQRASAGELRLLAKRNADNRICIAEAGAIPLLVSLLSTSDPYTQEHAVTALLNLSILDGNKGSIVMAGAIPGVVDVLKKGRMEARENAAATLFSLSVVDENKVMIGASGAIPALVELLSEGSQRGKKDAATALFNLCIYQGNKVRAVRAGVVVPLMRLLAEPGGIMVDEALAILAILASHQEGKVAIGGVEAVPVLVELVATGSPRIKENAAAVLVALCSGDVKHIAEAYVLGALGPLLDLAQNGTSRAKRKAGMLLEHMGRLVEQQEQAQEAQANEQVQAQEAQVHEQVQAQEAQAHEQVQAQETPVQSQQPRPTLAGSSLDG